MTTNTLSPETMAWGLMISLWQRRFIDQWTTDEVVDWHRRFIVKGSGKAAPTTAKGGRRGHGVR
jgi:hypothetical protein